MAKRKFIVLATLLVACGGEDSPSGAGVDAGTAGSAGATGGSGGATGGSGGATGGGGGASGGSAGATGGSGGASGGGGSAGAPGGSGGASGGSGGGGGGAGTALRFYGAGVNDIDRVKIRIDDETNAQPGPPVDVGGDDFTIEFWTRGTTADNTAGAINCGGYDWIYGNIVFDRDRYNQGRAFGVSFAAGRVVFGVNDSNQTAHTICGSSNALDGKWHHIAVQRRRSDGRLWIFVDGNNEAEADGPDGDVSYPDTGVPGNYCGGPCTFSDPFIVLGAEKHDAGSSFPSFNGFFDELRISKSLRYTANFTPPTAPFAPDASTVGLYHFDEGTGTTASDASGAAGGPSNGTLKVGGSPAGPEWSTNTPF